MATGNIDNGLGWWGGRPEFIESTYYLYRATKDPWYLHVGEMVLRDIKRRCWTKCGWAGLQDVRNGELTDRMESFFLGETAKYLFLLYDPDHPLNGLDAPFVFSTEGHPLIIPKSGRTIPHHYYGIDETQEESPTANICEAPPSPLPFGHSSTAARPDIFHAASLARLHLMPSLDEVEGAILEYASDHPSVTLSDLSSPSNYTFYPWTLPPELVPFNAISSPMAIRPTIDISFPSLPGMIVGPGTLERVQDGVLIKAIAGLRLGMVQDTPVETAVSLPVEVYRIQVINNLGLGKDEKVYLSRQITFDVVNPTDPNFTRIRDSILLDIVVDVDPESFRQRNHTGTRSGHVATGKCDPLVHKDSGFESPNNIEGAFSHVSSMRTVLSSLMNHVSSILRDDAQSSPAGEPHVAAKPARLSIPAIIPIGLGSAPLPDVDDSSVFTFSGRPSIDGLSWSTIYVSDELCEKRLPLDVVRNHQVLVIKRGGCQFSQKLRNIPAFPASPSALQLVIVVSYDSEDLNEYGETGFQAFVSTSPPTSPFYPKAGLLAEPYLVRPHLDEVQVTHSGIPRPNPISMIMVGGGDDTYRLLRSAAGVGIKRRYTVRSQGVPISNLHII